MINNISEIEIEKEKIYFNIDRSNRSHWGIVIIIHLKCRGDGDFFLALLSSYKAYERE